MPHDLIFDRIVERLRREAELAAAARRPRVRDSISSLVLGTLALGIGLVTLGATLAGVAGVPLGPWNEPCNVLTGPSSNPVVATFILVPSPYCVGVELVGAALGGAGFALGMLRRRVSWVSLAGFIFNFLCPLAGLAYESVMNLIY
jgi:hypothetical protein